MGKYSKDKNYDNLIAFNATRKDYNCPCCGKSFLLSDAKLEKFELDRELVYRPEVEYRVRYGAFRVCHRCEKIRDFSISFPLAFTKIYVILAIITSIIACSIDFDKYGTVTIVASSGATQGMKYYLN